MPTPFPGNPISMNDVYLETNLTRNMDNFFDVSVVGGGGGGMYHNLAMGPSTSLSFKQAIYDPHNANANLKLSNWYNYSQDEPVKLDWTFTNQNTENNVDVNLGLYDPNSTSFTMFTSFTVNNSGGQNIEINYNTNQNPSSYADGVYRVVIDVGAFYVGGGRPPGGGVNNNNTSANDTDGVGAGTARQPNNIPSFDSNNPITQFFLVDGTVNGTDIYINKRTSFDVEFN